MPGKKAEAPKGAPDWVVTYGDTMSLLLCFFIILFSMSEIKQDEKMRQTIESLRKAFGGHEGTLQVAPVEDLPTNTLIQRLLVLEPPVHKNLQGDSDEEGVEGKEYRVHNVRDGIQVVIGGRISFDRFSAVLKPEARELVAKVAETIRGCTTRILVRGHATIEPLPGDAPYDDARDLSYARAVSVCNELEERGLQRAQLLAVAAGDAEPLLRQAYGEERLAINRRVEIIVTEQTVDELAGAPAGDEKKEPTHGR